MCSSNKHFLLCGEAYQLAVLISKINKQRPTYGLTFCKKTNTCLFCKVTAIESTLKTDTVFCGYHQENNKKCNHYGNDVFPILSLYVSNLVLAKCAIRFNMPEI
jgi:hypothetical protein